MKTTKKILTALITLGLFIMPCKLLAVENVITNEISNEITNELSNTIENKATNEVANTITNEITNNIVNEILEENNENENNEEELPELPCTTEIEPNNENEDYYTGSTDEHERNENCLSNVTEEMCTPEYWEDKTAIDSDEELMSADEIEEFNQAIVDGSGTMVFDLTEMKTTYDADSRRNSLASTVIPTRKLYINGQLINNQEYFGNLNSAIASTGFTGTQNVLYAVCANRTDMKSWPIDDVIGYTATDRDDEMESTALNLNDPLVIYGKCEINNNIYYWGYCNNCTGWVNGKNIAICNSREEWLEYWQVDIEGDNFIVTTGSQINLEKDESETIGIMLGTVLKTVPDEEIPDNLKGINTEENYIVYFAGKDDNGNTEKKYAVINKDLEVNKGFLKLTQKNVLNVAFSCLGDEYGWGGMNGKMDCSLYTRQIYKCFGLELPRNTTWQQKTPIKFVDISKMTDDEKFQYISNLPAGSLLYFPGHAMMYIGTDSNKNFVVSDLGQACDEEDGSELQDIYSVNINSLNVKRKNGKTWLNNLTGVIDMTGQKYSYEFIENECVNFTAGEVSNYSFRIDGDDKRFESLSIGNMELIRGEDYTVKHGSTIITLTDKGIEKLNSLSPMDYEVKVKYLGMKEIVSGKLTLASVSSNPIEQNQESTTETDQTKDVTPIEQNQEATTDSTPIKDVTPKTGTNNMIYYVMGMMVLSRIGINLLKEKK